MMALEHTNLGLKVHLPRSTFIKPPPPSLTPVTVPVVGGLISRKVVDNQSRLSVYRPAIQWSRRGISPCKGAIDSALSCKMWLERVADEIMLVVFHNDVIHRILQRTDQGPTSIHTTPHMAQTNWRKDWVR